MTKPSMGYKNTVLDPKEIYFLNEDLSYSFGGVYSFLNEAKDLLESLRFHANEGYVSGVPVYMTLISNEYNWIKNIAEVEQDESRLVKLNEILEESEEIWRKAQIYEHQAHLERFNRTYKGTCFLLKRGQVDTAASRLADMEFQAQNIKEKFEDKTDMTGIYTKLTLAKNTLEWVQKKDSNQ